MVRQITTGEAQADASISGIGKIYLANLVVRLTWSTALLQGEYR